MTGLKREDIIFGAGRTLQFVSETAPLLFGTDFAVDFVSDSVCRGDIAAESLADVHGVVARFFAEYSGLSQFPDHAFAATAARTLPISRTALANWRWFGLLGDPGASFNKMTAEAGRDRAGAVPRAGRANETRRRPKA